MKRGLEKAVLVSPALLLVGLVVVGPVLRVVFLSLHDVSLEGGLQTRFVGLETYRRSWLDGRWLDALANTAAFTALSVAGEAVLGTAFALLLHRRFRGRGIARAVVMVPWALPTAVMALGWAWIFNDSLGVLNDLLTRLGLVDRPLAWLGSPGTALAAMVAADVWKTTPFVMLVVLAGLQGIPETVMEAATLDGLDGAQRLRYVVLPLLLPSLTVAVLFRAVQAYAAFDLPYVLTGGGPAGSTETVSLYAYRCYFRYLDFGYGSALAVEGMLMALLLASATVALARRGQP